jgi:glycerate dehydrogenase
MITPHIGWATKEARVRLIAQVVENVRAWQAGSPVNVVS